MKLARACLTLVGVWGVVACDSPVQPTPATAGQIAFVSNGSDSLAHIYVLDLDRSTVTQLTSGRHNDNYPAWSPDRRRIAFARLSDPANEGIWLMQADGSGAVRLSSQYSGGGLTWSPDGTRIAIMSGAAMSVIRTDGSGESRVTDSLPDLSLYLWPAWSPDGSTIAFDGQTDLVPSQVYLMEANGSNLRRLTSDCTYGTCGTRSVESMPAWSPDGKRVAFWSSGFGITVANQDGSGAFSVTKDYYEPDWSPDGERLVFVDVNRQLVVARADGTGAVQLVPNPPGGAYNPAWSR